MGELKVDGVGQARPTSCTSENVRKAARDGSRRLRAAAGIDRAERWTWTSTTRPRPRRSGPSSGPGSTSTSPTSAAATGSAARMEIEPGAARDAARVEPRARRRALRRDRLARGVRRAGRRDHGAGRVRRGDAPRAGAGHAEPARPVEHRAGDHRARHRGAEARRSSPACCAATTSGARASPSPTRAPTSRRCSTSAVLDGDHFVVNGQKTWNTLGHLANWCELLVRTDPDVPEAQGHLVPARRHDAARRRGAAARHDHRREGVQRDLLHRRARAR